ncbi:MAG TPA: DNRLRE domain-containing protein [Ignavibacteria bacterium]|nr:DNRLRE domain-containing protein [Ignavibacteria bacterium]
MPFIKNYSVKLFLILFTAVTLVSCENNPNSTGITFISPDDTLSTRVLDSQLDSMPITNKNYLNYINTSSSQNFLVGNYQNYTSKSLLKFVELNQDLDSASIVSAILTLKYNDYSFNNKSGLTSMNVYQMTTNFNYSTVLYDSVSSSNYGSVSKGSYSGTPAADTQKVNITLNNQMVKDWLEYSADTSYPVKNYGMILLPDASSSTISGFYSFNNTTDLIPYITVIYSKNSVVDTANINVSEYVTLSNAPPSIIPADRFVLQSGVAYRNVLNFDLTRLPSNVIINNVNLQFTLDSKNSIISSSTDKRVVLGMVVDSVNNTDSIFVDAFQSDSVTYVLSSTALNAIFQRWNSGVVQNLGLSMKNYFETQNMDHFVFFSPSAAEVSFRPRIRITYTLRN